jgi:Tfp pilus assembly protein PilX
MKGLRHRNKLGTRQVTTRGFALPTLMVVLALASMATLLALRNLWVNDQLLNAEADQLRTQYKAEAVLPVALADLVGTTTNHDSETLLNLRHLAANVTQNHAFFPTSMAEYDLLRQRLNTGASLCSVGICAPNTLDANATTASYWKEKTNMAMPVSATDTPYGDYTAWYWVEVFPLTTPATTMPPFAYRITTLANGVMPSSTTVLQAIWVRSTPSTGQWHSWHVLHD